MQLKAFTKFAFGKAFCSCSINDSSSDVKNLRIPFSGAAFAIGYEVSITVLFFQIFST